jgi:hypothetical protein
MGRIKVDGIDDSELRIPALSPICTFCKHLLSIRRCAAFDEIPLPIWKGENNHTRPYPGDGGIRFEQVDPDSD